MGEDGVVIGLDDVDGKGQSGQDVLDKGFGRIGSHLFVELNDAQAGGAVDGRELIESTSFEEVRDEFYIDLEEVAWAGYEEGSAVAFGVGFSFSG